MSPWLFINVYIDGVMKVKMGIGRSDWIGNELPGGWERVEIAWSLVCG